MDVQAIEKDALDYFLQGKGSVLQDAWDQICELEQQQQFPEIAYQLAKIYFQDYQFVKIRQHLEICLNAWAEYPDNKARVYLLYALVSIYNKDFGNVSAYLATVEALTDDPLLTAELYFVRGLMKSETNPMEAIDDILKARKWLLSVQHLGYPAFHFDLARISIQAAVLAMHMNMRAMAWVFHREAKEAATEYPHHDDLQRLMTTRTGHLYELEGSYQAASDYYLMAIEQYRYHHRNAEAIYRLAHLNMLMNHDREALQLLTVDLRSTHLPVVCQELLLKGWLYALEYNIEQARFCCIQVDLLKYNNDYLIHSVTLLKGFLAAQSEEVDQDIITNLEASVVYFADQYLTVEDTQGRFLLAWLYALLDDRDSVRKNIEQVESGIAYLGYTRHLSRFYQCSLPLMGGWWRDTTRAKIEETLQHPTLTNGIRIYGFGEVRVQVEGEDLLQRDRYQLSAKLIIFMLEKQKATIEEIAAVLWPEAQLSTAKNRFHSLLSSTKKMMPDWCVYADEDKHYILQPDFPAYYDVAEFNRLYKLFQTQSIPNQKLALALNLIKLYEPFAENLEGEVFEAWRSHYEDCFRDVVAKAEHYLATIQNRLSTEWYDELKAPFSLS
jgi:hypothetical protein